MVRYGVAELERMVAALAEHSGVRREDAQVFAQALVDADAHGTSTHGVSRVGIYLERIRRGVIDPQGELRVEHSHGAVLRLDAGNALGQVAATRTLELLTPLAHEHGVASATVRRSQHFGTLSHYTARAAREGMILMLMSTAEPAMAPTGGYEAFFGTNPIAAAFPVPGAEPVRIDLATSVVARGNIIAAQRRGEAIPEGWALDERGQPTTDAAEALRGTVQTMAGHKGYALALMVEMFSSVLSGAAVGPEIGSMYKNLDRPQDVGHFFCLFDIGAFLPRAEYDERVRGLVDTLKRNRRQPGVEEILLPGERSGRKAAANRAAGVTLGEETVAELRRLCDEAGVPFAAMLEE